MKTTLALVLAAATDLDSVEFFIGDSLRPLTLLNEAGSLSDTSAFYLAGDEFGATTLIHVDAYRGGDGFEAAYEAWIDSMPAVEKAELSEAYCDPRDKDERTFEDIARDQLGAIEPCPNYWERDAWEAWHEKKNALASRLLDECATAAHENHDDYPEVSEGYREDSSGEVKNVGHHENFYKADLAEIVIREKAPAEITTTKTG